MRIQTAKYISWIIGNKARLVVCTCFLAFAVVVTASQAQGDTNESLQLALNGSNKPVQIKGNSLGALDTAGRLALGALFCAGIVFGLAYLIKRAKENSLGTEHCSNLMVKDSVWIGRGQRVVLLSVGEHRVLVGVSGGSIHSLGVFSNDEGSPVILSPIEREAALLDTKIGRKGEFSDLITGEISEQLTKVGTASTRERRQQMVAELNSL
ncbi:MAG: flagellar biosynthetic protein FliO [Myxococcales bacterium]|nr:flagellar biosynthetic protein FliO [Myxococcales bacterium]